MYISNVQLSPNSKMIAVLTGNLLQIYQLDGLKKVIEKDNVYDYCWKTNKIIY